MDALVVVVTCHSITLALHQLARLQSQFKRHSTEPPALELLITTISSTESDFSQPPLPRVLSATISTMPQMHPADKLPSREQMALMINAQLLEKQQADLRPLPVLFGKREAIELVEQASRSSDLDTISSLVDEHHLTPEDLQAALAWVARGKEPRIIRSFLDQGVRGRCQVAGCVYAFR